MVDYVYTLVAAVGGEWGMRVDSRILGGALASWQMFPARPRHSSSVNLRDVQVVPRLSAEYPSR